MSALDWVTVGFGGSMFVGWLITVVVFRRAMRRAPMSPEAQSALDAGLASARRGEISSWRPDR